jgi:hypothetical protein
LWTAEQLKVESLLAAHSSDGLLPAASFFIGTTRRSPESKQSEQRSSQKTRMAPAWEE